MSVKILILSDLNWHPHLRSITNAEVIGFSESDLSKERYQRIWRYFDIVIKEKPDLVLLSGDITGDGSCGHGYQNALKIFLLLLESRKISSRFISGNHDPDPYYSDLLSFVKDLAFTEEISNRIVQFKDLSIVGINYDCTRSLTKLNAMLKECHSNKPQICLAHSEIKRRIRLFETGADLIATGHFDRKLMLFDDSVYISLDNDWEEVSYGTAVFQKDILKEASVNIRQDSSTTLTLTQLSGSKSLQHIMTANGQPALDLHKIEGYPDSALMDDSGENWVYLKHIRGINLAQAYTSLWKTKNGVPFTENDLPFNNVYKLAVNAKYKISKVFINDYLKS